jgi:hypothetical protein
MPGETDGWNLIPLCRIGPDSVVNLTQLAAQSLRLP